MYSIMVFYPLSYSNQVDATREYKDIVYIRKFGDTFTHCGGVNLPKVVTCVCSDGQRRRQLIKVFIVCFKISRMFHLHSTLSISNVFKILSSYSTSDYIMQIPTGHKKKFMQHQKKSLMECFIIFPYVIFDLNLCRARTIYVRTLSCNKCSVSSTCFSNKMLTLEKRTSK